MLPYLTIPFSISESNLAWIRQSIQPTFENFQQNAPLSAALVTDTVDNVDWYGSLAYQEIMEHLSFTPVSTMQQPAIQWFLYKQLPRPKLDCRGNPHIDTFNDVDGLVPIRFNILIEGSDNEEMTWWDITDVRHPSLCIDEFTNPRGEKRKRLQAQGATIADRWKNLGEPAFKNNQLTKINQWASFVRTDMLHSINWTGSAPRIIMSLRFLEPWSVIECFQSQYQCQ